MQIFCLKIFNINRKYCNKINLFSKFDDSVKYLLWILNSWYQLISFIIWYHLSFNIICYLILFVIWYHLLFNIMQFKLIDIIWFHDFFEFTISTLIDSHHESEFSKWSTSYMKLCDKIDYMIMLRIHTVQNSIQKI